MSQFRALVVPADVTLVPYWHEFTGYRDIQAKVGGTFDVFTAEFGEDMLSVYVDDEGLYRQSTPNILGTMLRGYQIKGDIVLAGGVDDEGEQLSLPTDIGDNLILASPAIRSAIEGVINDPG